MVKISYLSHKTTHFFSELNTDYLSGDKKLADFYRFTPDDKGLQKAIEERKKYPVDRKLLVAALRRQYEGFVINDKVNTHIDLLLSENTFTVCTAHQPNLMTGYLYFIYKIIHAAKLAQHLKTQHSEYNFVPVFYIGSEDNDIEELGTFRFNGIKFKWSTEQKGAVGRMKTEDPQLRTLLQQLNNLIGPPGANADKLKEVLYQAYQKQATIADATRYIVNELLGDYGIVVLDPDDKMLKEAFLPVLSAELLHQRSDQLVQAPSQKLNQYYKAQAFSRPVNLFYLNGDTRERIEYSNGSWSVLRTPIRWEKAGLEQELKDHPERFSPNVILRGLFQESVLPNVAFIGGGSEVAYWLQLKPLFEQYKIFYPALILRQSVLWMDAAACALQRKTNLTDEEIFEPAEKLARSFVHKHTHKDLQLEDLKLQLNRIFEQVKNKASHIDITLKSSADAALTKMRYQLDTVEKKMMRAEKRNMAEDLAQIYKLKNRLFPNESLQERYDTFMPYYIDMGDNFFEYLMQYTLPYGDRFLLLKCG